MTINFIPVVVVLCAMVAMIATVGYIIFNANDDDYWS